MVEWELDVALPEVPPTHIEENYTSLYTLDVEGIQGNDLCYRLHPNGLCVVALAPSHAAHRRSGGGGDSISGTAAAAAVRLEARQEGSIAAAAATVVQSEAEAAPEATPSAQQQAAQAAAASSEAILQEGAAAAAEAGDALQAAVEGTGAGAQTMAAVSAAAVPASAAAGPAAEAGAAAGAAAGDQKAGAARLVVGQKLKHAEFRKGRGPLLQLDSVLGRLSGVGSRDYVLRCGVRGLLIELNARLQGLRGEALLRALAGEYVAILELRSAEAQQLAGRCLSEEQYQQHLRQQQQQLPPPPS